jgi:hypothetical protein
MAVITLGGEDAHLLDSFTKAALINDPIVLFEVYYFLNNKDSQITFGAVD